MSDSAGSCLERDGHESHDFSEYMHEATRLASATIYIANIFIGRKFWDITALGS